MFRSSKDFPRRIDAPEEIDPYEDGCVGSDQPVCEAGGGAGRPGSFAGNGIGYGADDRRRRRSPRRLRDGGGDASGGAGVVGSRHEDDVRGHGA
jgi:hypothetical protein